RADPITSEGTGPGVEQPLPAERHRRIHELLREQRVVRVSVLSEQLGVSEVTIRRDLEVLERRGMLERTHGGAVATQWVRSEPAYRDAASTNPIEKRLIGAAAAALVEQGDALYLNGGTTTLQVFRHLRATGLKVATNHVGIALEAADRGPPPHPRDEGLHRGRGHQRRLGPHDTRRGRGRDRPCDDRADARPGAGR